MAITTGGPLQQVPVNAPPQLTTLPAPAPIDSPLARYMTPTASPFAGRDYNALVQNSLESFMNPNSQLMQNARQRGMEVAATRGGINSSIAAGASERAAMEMATPLAQGAVASQLGQEQAILANWQEEQGFARDLVAKPFESSMNMLQRVQEYALEDPQLYTPSVTSGFTNFFNQNMNDMIKRYFGG